MSAFESAESVTEAFHAGPREGGPTPLEIDELREQLTADLNEVVVEWTDRPDGWLRVNKTRMRSTALCPAQVLGEAEPSELSANLVVGIICDIAAGVVALHQGFARSGNWLSALEPTLQQEQPDVVDYINQLEPDDRAMLIDDIDDRCRHLGALLGDLRNERLTIRERSAYLSSTPAFCSPLRSISQSDLAVASSLRSRVVLLACRLLMNSATMHCSVALRDGILPRGGCAVALGDGQRHTYPVAAGRSSHSRTSSNRNRRAPGRNRQVRRRRSHRANETGRTLSLVPARPVM